MKRLAQFDEVELPQAVESAARLVVLGDELRVLVNSIENHHTEQMLITRSRDLRMLEPLPLMTASACGRRDSMVVTGSNQMGEPMIASVARDGSVSWLTALEGSMPLRWPLPGGGAPARIAWMMENGRIETAIAGPAGIADQKSFEAGGPPLEVAMSTDAAWALWSDEGGVWLANSGGSRQKLEAHYCSELAIDASGNDVWAAWMREHEVHWKRIGDEVVHQGATTSSTARLGITAGKEAVIALRYAETEDEKLAHWTTELILQDTEGWAVKELLHSVAWWGDNIVAAGTNSVRFLKAIEM